MATTTAPSPPRHRSWWEVVFFFLLAFLLAFLMKTFLFQVFSIPSTSMLDTLRVGDRVVVEKVHAPLQRGDVVVFEDPGGWLPSTPPVKRSPLMEKVHEGLQFLGLLPEEGSSHLIKRVVGLPGDKVACCDASGLMTVNGKAVQEPYLKAGEKPSEIPFSVTIPRGHLWMMGDNRSQSGDSRFHGQGLAAEAGAVPQEKVVGRALLLLWPFSRLGMVTDGRGAFAEVPPPAAAP